MTENTERTSKLLGIEPENNPSIRTENWLGHEIRFIEKNPGDWWAVLSDITEALMLTPKGTRQRLAEEVISNYPLPTAGGIQVHLIVNEDGIYDTILGSRKKEAVEFRHWVRRLLKTMREASGLEGFQVFRMLDGEHQRETMAMLNQSLQQPARVDYIKANTIADKAVSMKCGEKKMIRKRDMTPAMLVERQPILQDTVELMGLVDKYHLPISVSETIYSRHGSNQSTITQLTP